MNLKPTIIIRLLLSAAALFVLLPARSQNEGGFKVSGIVTDTDKNPLAGATVKESGTTRGMVTNREGTFELAATSPDATLEISYLGFETLRVKVSGQSFLNVSMKESLIELSDVVVVGYGKMSGKDIAGSIVSLSEKDLNKGPGKSVAQMIQGKVAGVYISRDGDPNSDGSLIIRGTSTLRTGAQNPLYVIDGVPGAGMVSPEDIVSIDILKDASALLQIRFCTNLQEV